MQILGLKLKYGKISVFVVLSAYWARSAILTKYGLIQSIYTIFKASSIDRPNMGRNIEWYHLK